MNVGSCFTGVGGLDLGLERAGHRIVWQCEADPYRRRVLARHWPGVPCFEDVRALNAAPRPSRNGAGRRALGGGGNNSAGDGALGGAAGVDLLCGGFPCQGLSVAGLRRGLADDRSRLFFEFARIADAVLGDGGWLLIENVPGLFSSNGGRDFAVLLATLGDLGFHDLAWRVLDSRYFGVPQRRRRVFILARRASGERARAVLLEPESGGGDFEAGSQAGPRVAASLSRGSSGAGVSALDQRGGGADDNEAQGGQLVVGTVRSHTRPGSNDVGGVVAHTLRAEGFDASEDGTGRGTPLVSTPTDPDGMRAPTGVPGYMDDPGWPNPRPDGPRYAACGDAVTVPVAEWIGRRLRDAF